MNKLNIFVIFLLAACATKCWAMRHHHHDSDEEEDGVGLTVGQMAAMALACVVAIALVIITVIAIILKCNKKTKQAVKPMHVHTVSEITPTQKFSNLAPLYDDLPPKYSLRDEEPNFQVSLPPPSETFPTKHAM